MATTTEKFRSKEIVEILIKKIKKEAEKAKEKIKIMHVCGTHEHDIVKAGLRSLLPEKIELMAGPGCPVCVSSSQDVDEVLWIADTHNVTITTFGDMMRVPGSKESLYQAQGRGVDVRVVYSIADAIKLAEKDLSRDVVFLSVGFETTSCITASEVLRPQPSNFSIYSSHKLVPHTMELLLQRDDIEFHGYLAPGHVSTIIGVKPYIPIAEKYHFPISIAGFEPVDILLGVYSLVRQIVTDSPVAENVYKRYVRYDGNTAALKAMERAFSVADVRWRGLGVWPESGHEIKDEFAHIDAKKKYDIPQLSSIDLRGGCICDEILIGKSKPYQCPLFNKACTPEHPIGACMVSHEGTCNVAVTYEDIVWEE
ncbi:MAG: hydrogenase formation protein HypD [Candidatus Heimdallarchaeaceae archaeon]